MKSRNAYVFVCLLAVLSLLPSVPLMAEELSTGERIFSENCSVCHGDKGDKGMYATTGLNPPPRNFTDDMAREELSRERMIYSVTHGRPGTAMMPWGNRLSPEEIERVVDHVRDKLMFPMGEHKWHMQMGMDMSAGASMQGHDHNAHWDLADIAKPMPFSLNGDVERGKEFYDDNCSVCHGEQGNGQGPRSHFIFPKPRDFTATYSLYKFSREHLFYTVSDGVVGTEMPAWKHVLDRQTIADVVEYVFQSFIAPNLPEGYVDQMAAKLREKPAAMGHSHGGGMHPSLPWDYIKWILLFMVLVLVWSLISPPPKDASPFSLPLTRIPVIAPFVRFLNRSAIPVSVLKVISMAAYLLVIVAGIFGTVHAEHNFATVLVWGLWWPLVIISVFFFGSAWCAICPWESLSKLAVLGKLWRRPNKERRRTARVPKKWRNVYPALLLFMGLTWLELGAGVTTIPWATAGMALVMFVLASICLYLWERKAFCRYFCPVGRTIGYYGRLAPVEVRPEDESICATCTTLECYRGTEEIEPCPTNLVVGRFSENTFCISCGSCMLSCPHKNVTWRLRAMDSEATTESRPRWDGAWFMLGLLAITIFHGLTMLGPWGEAVTWMSGILHDRDPYLLTFTIMMLLGFALPVAIYALCIWAVRFTAPGAISFKQLFSRLAFASLPLAFAYHLAHNLDHFIREKPDFWAVLMNPLGEGMRPLTNMERHILMMETPIADHWIFLGQSLLMMFGFWVAMKIIRFRSRDAVRGGGDLSGYRLLPAYLFAVVITVFNLWLLGQSMVMRL
jgi:polyferredoxin/mono/diheme cytochrome c family protein